MSLHRTQGLSLAVFCVLLCGCPDDPGPTVTPDVADIDAADEPDHGMSDIGLDANGPIVEDVEPFAPGLLNGVPVADMPVVAAELNAASTRVHAGTWRHVQPCSAGKRYVPGEPGSCADDGQPTPYVWDAVPSSDAEMHKALESGLRPIPVIMPTGPIDDTSPCAASRDAGVTTVIVTRIPTTRGQTSATTDTTTAASVTLGRVPVFVEVE